MSKRNVGRIVIPNWKPPSLNEYLGHWAKRAKTKKSVRTIISAYAKQAKIDLASKHRTVSMGITLSGRQRIMDNDNCWKAVLDALKLAGMLVDDNPKWCTTTTVGWSRGTATQTVIDLYEEDDK